MKKLKLPKWLYTIFGVVCRYFDWRIVTCIVAIFICNWKLHGFVSAIWMTVILSVFFYGLYRL